MGAFKRNHANQVGPQGLDALEQRVAHQPHVGANRGDGVQQGEAVHRSEGVVRGKNDPARPGNAVQVAVVGADHPNLQLASVNKGVLVLSLGQKDFPISSAISSEGVRSSVPTVEIPD